MLLYLTAFWCTLIAINGVVISSALKWEELVLEIGNKHMLGSKDASLIKNVQKHEIFKEYLARDCRAAFRRGRRESGLYVISPKHSPLLVVYCDMEHDGGGWTVLHRNEVNQKSVWSNTWEDYKRGFGKLLENHWLGNEHMYHLTNQNAFSVRFLIVDGNGQTKHADYHSFKVDSEENGYALRLGNYSGDAGDALTTVGEAGVHDNMRFSTRDEDHDRRASTNCALENAAGWWYDNCYSALLTSSDQIRWRGLCTAGSGCKSATILIRPNGKNCNKPPRY